MLFVITSCFSSAQLFHFSFYPFNINNLVTLLFASLPVSQCTSTPPHPPSYSFSLPSDMGSQWRKARPDFKRLPVYLSPPRLNWEGSTAIEINSSPHAPLPLLFFPPHHHLCLLLTFSSYRSPPRPSSLPLCSCLHPFTSTFSFVIISYPMW